MKNKILGIAFLFSIGLNAQSNSSKVTSSFTDSFKYKGYTFYNKTYVYTNTEFAQKRKIQYAESNNTDFYWSDTMPSNVSISDLLIKGPDGKWISKMPALDTIREKTFGGDVLMDVKLTKYTENFEKYCSDIADSNAENGFITLEQGFTFDKVNTFKNFITLYSYNYEFAGGAHPSHFSFSYTIDLETGKLIQLNDVFNQRLIKQLKAILFKKFNKHYGKSNLLGDFEIASNFSLTLKGISFLYNNYEITPYAFGNPDLFLTYSEAYPYLNPMFKKWVTIVPRKTSSSKKIKK